jgi:hypothetical protein
LRLADAFSQTTKVIEEAFEALKGNADEMNADNVAQRKISRKQRPDFALNLYLPEISLLFVQRWTKDELDLLKDKLHEKGASITAKSLKKDFPDREM